MLLCKMLYPDYTGDMSRRLRVLEEHFARLEDCVSGDALNMQPECDARYAALEEHARALHALIAQREDVATFFVVFGI